MRNNSSCVVLITGATGHVGFRTLVHTLSAGYTVRAAVRSQAKANTILSHPQIQSLNPGPRLTFDIVPDIAAPYAYDRATWGAHCIIHIASPLTANYEVALIDQDAHYIQPAVRGTLGMLEAAQRSGTVRRVVITSSIVALASIAQMEGEEPLGRPVRPTDRVPFVPGPYENEFAAYAASKVASLQAAESWMAANRPVFDVVYLHPSFVEGRNDLATTVRGALTGTNTLILGIVLGKQFGTYAGATVHNEDVARVHVQALNPEIPGNTNYILSQPTRWNDAKDIVRRAFPEAVQKRTLPNCGSTVTYPLAVDTSLTERTFGFKHMGFEEQVLSVVGHYLELRAGGNKRYHTEQQMNRSIGRSQHVTANA